MDNKKTIDVLNTLIVINNDRIEGYETAYKETDEADLKTLFAHFKQTSEKCRAELTDEVKRLGGTPDEGTRTTGKFFRVWMDVKAALTGKDRKIILDSCEYGEGVAAETYSDVLSNELESLSAEQQTMLHEQYSLLKSDGEKVESLKDMLEEHK
jgi:uncharacterized protein (TIGR02284 family)